MNDRQRLLSGCLYMQEGQKYVNGIDYIEQTKWVKKCKQERKDFLEKKERKKRTDIVYAT